MRKDIDMSDGRKDRLRYLNCKCLSEQSSAILVNLHRNRRRLGFRDGERTQYFCQFLGKFDDKGLRICIIREENRNVYISVPLSSTIECVAKSLRT